MRVRPATLADYPDLERMGRSFAVAAKQPKVDPTSLRFTIDSLIENGILLVAENNGIVGGAGALVFPHYWNANELVAQELFWWVDPDARGSSAGMKMLLRMELEAKERGAKKLMMICLDELDGERVAHMYERSGYRPQERTFVKVL